MLKYLDLITLWLGFILLFAGMWLTVSPGVALIALGLVISGTEFVFIVIEKLKQI